MLGNTNQPQQWLLQCQEMSCTIHKKFSNYLKGSGWNVKLVIQTVHSAHAQGSQPQWQQQWQEWWCWWYFRRSYLHQTGGNSPLSGKAGRPKRKTSNKPLMRCFLCTPVIKAGISVSYQPFRTQTSNNIYLCRGNSLLVSKDDDYRPLKVKQV